VTPWPSLLLDTFSVGIWYNVINQFMIQRVFGAKNMYHARMGIVLAGYMKVLMPALVILPGMILFALPHSKDLLAMPLDALTSGGADKGYMAMLQLVLPAGIRGLFLAALIGAIQSTINAVLNSTATMITLDIYQRHINKTASDRNLVAVGRASTVVVLIISILLAGFIQSTNMPLFVYIQTLYAFFAPPFSAIFLLGILFRRINTAGSIAAVVVGFPLGILIKIYVASSPSHPIWLEPFANQAILNWFVCTIVCLVVSLLTAPPRPEQVNDTMAINWRKLNIFGELGTTWYNSVVLWWGIFVVGIIALFILFSGIWL
jgi:SSS family solute:Na+ symporter